MIVSKFPCFSDRFVTNLTSQRAFLTFPFTMFENIWFEIASNWQFRHQSYEPRDSSLYRCDVYDVSRETFPLISVALQNASLRQVLGQIISETRTLLPDQQRFISHCQHLPQTSWKKIFFRWGIRYLRYRWISIKSRSYFVFPSFFLYPRLVEIENRVFVKRSWEKLWTFYGEQ